MLDFMVTEAVVARAAREAEEYQKEQERRAWRREHKKMGR